MRTPAEPTADQSPPSRTYSDWVVLHVPHDSVEVPAAVRSQFLLDDAELTAELRRMTDQRTLAMFACQTSSAAVVHAPVSRLVVDVERLKDDNHEPMFGRGMSAIYVVRLDLTPLRMSAMCFLKPPITATQIT